jgi:hypothetical protein
VEKLALTKLPTGRNAGFVVVFGTWPARVLKHRGWTPEKQIYQRVATPEEHDWLAGCLRYQAFHYADEDGLLDDEKQALLQWPSVFDSLKARVTEQI